MHARRTVLALAAALVVAATAACTPDGESPPAPTVTRTTGPITLTLGVYGPAPVISAYTTIASRFSAEHPNVTVSVKPYADHDTALADISGSVGTKAQPDVFLVDSDDLPTLMDKKANQRVDGMLTKQNVDFGDGYQRVALEAFSEDNALQCMPVDISPTVVYYNAALVHLAQLRPPGRAVPNPDDGWRFDDFVTAAQQASQGGVKGVYVAPTLDQIAPFVFSGGGALVDDTEQPTTTSLASGSSSKALERLLELVRDPTLTNSQAQIQRRDALSRFKAGKLAMMLGDRSLTPELRAQEGLRFGVMPMPRVGRSATVADVTGFCVRSKAPHRTTAAQLLASIIGDKSMETLARTGYVTPANVEAIHSEAFLQSTQDPAGAQVFNNQNRFAQPLPRGPVWQQVTQQVDQQLTALFYDPVIDPLQDRLQLIDDAAKVTFGAAAASESPSPSGNPSIGPSNGADPRATPTKGASPVR